MPLDPNTANAQYKATITRLIAEHGNSYAVPRDEWNEASETLRLHLTIHQMNGKVTKQLLSQYMFPPSIIAKVNPDFDGFEPKVKRSSKYNAVYQWLDENSGVEVTTQDLCTVTEMSYPTTLKFIENNPQYFSKIKRGVYKVRDPKAEREAEKK